MKSSTAMLTATAALVLLLGQQLAAAGAPRSAEKNAKLNPVILQGPTDATCPPGSVGGCWVSIVENVGYGSTSIGPGKPSLVSGSFSKIRASHVSGYVSCNEQVTSSQDRADHPWQACRPSPSSWDFELMHTPAGGSRVFIFEQPAVVTLNENCEHTSDKKGPITCTVPNAGVWRVEVGDAVIPTWYEPSHGVDISDNGGTHVVNIEGWLDLNCDAYSQWLETEFMPVLQTDPTGFNTGVKDQFQILYTYHQKYYDVTPVLGGLVAGVDFQHAVAPSDTTPCWDVHTVTLDWGDLAALCSRGEEGGASGFVTFTCKIAIDSREPLDAIRDAALDREVHNELPFIVKFPKQVTVSVLDLTVHRPPNVLAAIIRQEVEVDVSQVTNVDAKVRLFTSTQYPFRLEAASPMVTLAPSVGAGLTVDSFVNVVDCADPGPSAVNVANGGADDSLACSQEWLIDLQIDASLICSLDGAYQVSFEAECHPDFSAATDCPLVPDDQGVIDTTFLVDFIIDSENFCPELVDTVDVSAALDVYKDLAHLTSASNFIQGQTAYFVVTAASTKVTIVSVSIDDIDVEILGGPNQGAHNFYLDGSANAGNPAGIALAVQNSNSGPNGNADQAWFNFVVASDPFEAPLDGSIDFNVDVVCNVVFKDASLNLLESKHRFQMLQAGSGRGQAFAATVQAGMINGDSDDETAAGSTTLSVAGALAGLVTGAMVAAE